MNPAIPFCAGLWVGVGLMLFLLVWGAVVVGCRADECEKARRG